VTEDGIALIWEFGDGRGTRRVPGSFTPAGGFLPGGNLVLIDRGGDIVLHDRATLMRQPVVFQRPFAGNSRRRSAWPFSSLAISGDGHIAAASREGPLACVWTSADGQLSLNRPIRDHRGGITSVSFSGDGRSLLTAGDDGLAKLWDITGGEPKIRRVLGETDPNATAALSPVTAAAVSPAAEGVIVLGRQDGRVEVWKPEATQPIRVAQLDGHVRTVAFSADGRLLAAGGDDRQITLRAIAQLGQPIPLSTRPNHFEMINALVFWPKGRLLASASDDATIRLWQLAQSKLTGNLSASGDGNDWVIGSCSRPMDCSTPPPAVRDASPGGWSIRTEWTTATGCRLAWNSTGSSDMSLTWLNPSVAERFPRSQRRSLKRAPRSSSSSRFRLLVPSRGGSI
jgi:WD40 repeat protein